MTIPNPDPFRFLQIHTLHAFPASLLNRDKSGMAKRIPMGGTIRLRISSQCLKSHWRKASRHKYALTNIPGLSDGHRSRNIIDRLVVPNLRSADEISKSVVDALATAFNKGLYGESGASIEGRQVLLVGLPESNYLRGKAMEIGLKYPDDPDLATEATNQLFSTKWGEGPNFRAFRENAKLPAGLVGALHGRMVTSDPAANIEGAVSVIHSFTIHAQETETDYFSAVDDLTEPGEHAGAAHIGESELTSGIYYGYVVVDLPTLVSNLEGCAPEDWGTVDRDLAGQVCESLVHLIATVSPDAKRGSTAPMSYADLMLVEMGDRQPRQLSNAYREASDPTMAAGFNSLSTYLAGQDLAYGIEGERSLMSAMPDLPTDGFSAVSRTMDGMGDWVKQMVASGVPAEQVS